MPAPDVELPGCYFADRCPRADATCTAQRPPLQPVGDAHRVACWHPLVGDDPAGQPAASAEASR
jgi:ABC-type dipeptide/oligopeptide/nickel transport system ATPase component